MRPNLARSRPRVIDTSAAAREIVSVFHDRAPRSEKNLKCDWPGDMQEVGRLEAVLYSSDKWQEDRHYEDYKHICESKSSHVYCLPFFVEDYFDKSKIPVSGPMVWFDDPMPLHFGVLGKLLGVQVRLYAEDGNGGVFLPKGDEHRRLYQVNVQRAKLGGAQHPVTGEKFLLVYTEDEGICMILTGDRLDIEKDGIVG